MKETYAARLMRRKIELSKRLLTVAGFVFISTGACCAFGLARFEGKQETQRASEISEISSCQNLTALPLEISAERRRQIHDEFAASRFVILNQLAQSGVTTIANQKLASLEINIGQGTVDVVPWTCVNEATSIDLPSVRESAQWWRDAKSKRHGVRVNAEAWPPDKAPSVSILDPMSVQNSLGLHESLGSIGVADDTYGCSLRLWYLSKRHDPANPLTDSEIKPISLAADKLCAIRPETQRLAGEGGSGSTGVGGGGDGESVMGKLTLIVRSLRGVENARTKSERQEALAFFYQSFDFEAFHIETDISVQH